MLPFQLIRDTGGNIVGDKIQLRFQITQVKRPTPGSRIVRC